MKQQQKELADAAATTSLDDLLEKRAELQARVARLVNAIESPGLGSSIALLERFRSAESELKVLEQRIASVRNPVQKQLSVEKIRKLVLERVQDLFGVCKVDVVKARQVLQQYIQRLILVPIDTPEGKMYEVIGDVDLFIPEMADLGVMLDRSSSGTVQHYTTAFQFSFAGLRLNPRSAHYRDECMTA